MTTFDKQPSSPSLNIWLKRATRRLSAKSAARVRAEIEDHYQSARDAALAVGASETEADATAINALGDPATANCQYRNTMLTIEEARMLGSAAWEARAFCTRVWFKYSLLSLPAGAFLAAAAFWSAGQTAVAQILLIAALGTAFLFGAPFLPIYTPARSRVFRVAKWLVLTGMLLVILQPHTLKWSWLLFSCLWPVAWVESTRTSIRRKLPVSQWPKALYL